MADNINLAYFVINSFQNQSQNKRYRMLRVLPNG